MYSTAFFDVGESDRPNSLKSSRAPFSARRMPSGPTLVACGVEQLLGLLRVVADLVGRLQVPALEHRRNDGVADGRVSTEDLVHHRLSVQRPADRLAKALVLQQWVSVADRFVVHQRGPGVERQFVESRVDRRDLRSMFGASARES